MPRLSAAQKSMALFETLNSHLVDPTTYYHTVAIQLEGKLNIELLQKALVEMTKRHEALRSTLRTVDQEEHLQPLEDKNVPISDSWPLSVVDGTALKDAPHIADLAQTLTSLGREELIYRRFKLFEEPLWRAWITKFNDELYHLGLLFHHIIFDVASQNIFLQELAFFYNNGVRKLPYHLSSTLKLDEIIPINEKNEKTKRVIYWKKTLEQLEPAELKPDFPTQVKNFKGDRVPIIIPATVIRRLTTEYKTTTPKSPSLHNVLTSFLAVLIYQYTGENDIYLATASANRRNYHFPVDNVINCFVNTVPLRIPISGAQTSQDFVQAIKKIATEAYQHQIAIADLCQEVTDEKGQRAKAPKGIFVFNQKKMRLKLIDAEGKAIKSTPPIELNLHHCKLDWGFELNECDDGSFEGFFDFSELFSRSTIERIAQHFLQICNNASPHLKLYHISMLTPDDHRALSAANDTNRPLVSQEFFHEYFMKVAKEIPDQICTIFYGGEDKYETRTYQEFDEITSLHAADLQRQKIAPGTRVGVCTSRSTLFMATMSAFKTGCVVVQLEAKEADQGSRMFKVDDAKPEVILVDNTTQSFFSGNKIKLINIEQKPESVASAEYQAPVIEADAPMYVTYTSGSTGKPKGAVNTWGGHRNLLHAWVDSNLTQGNNTLVTALPTFDAWYAEWLMAIVAKGKAIMIYDQGRLAPEILAKINTLYPIHVLVLLPQILDQLDPNVFLAVRDITSMGEPEKTLRKWLASGRVARGEYGVSEATIKNTVNVLSADDPKNCIGKPIRNTKLFILNVNDGYTECPPGVAGELYIAGQGLAQGYLNRDELTREKFLIRYYDPATHVFYNAEEKPNKPLIEIRLYKTGDLAVRATNGSIIIMGRADDQIKIHGQRIELSGIVSLLRAMPAAAQETKEELGQTHSPKKEAVIVPYRETMLPVKEALVIPDGEKKYLIVYLVLADRKSIITLESIQAYLRSFNLPLVAIPRALHILESFPLNKNGKIDRKALPEPNVPYVEKVVMPSTDLQTKLRKEWAEVFNRPEDSISVKRTFNEEGGDSFRIIWLLNKMNDPQRKHPWNPIRIQMLSEQMSIESLEREIKPYLISRDSPSASPGKHERTFQSLWETPTSPAPSGPIDDFSRSDLQLDDKNNKTFDSIFN